MSSTTQSFFAKDSWQTPRNARTLRAFMALQNQEIGARLAELRQSRGNPPQEAVAADLKVSYRSVQAWEAGESKPSWRNLQRLAEYYGVTAEYILIGVEDDDVAPADQSQLARIEAKLTQLVDYVAATARPSTAADRQALDHLRAPADSRAQGQRPRKSTGERGTGEEGTSQAQ